MKVSEKISYVLDGIFDGIFDDIYDMWGGDKKLDDQVATELQVPVFTGLRLEMITKKVNAIMG
jgi:hypothetical protein